NASDGGAWALAAGGHAADAIAMHTANENSRLCRRPRIRSDNVIGCVSEPLLALLIDLIHPGCAALAAAPTQATLGLPSVCAWEDAGVCAMVTLAALGDVRGDDREHDVCIR